MKYKTAKEDLTNQVVTLADNAFISDSLWLNAMLSLTIPKDMDRVGKDLFARFKTMQAIIDAPAGELREIRGVGEKTITLFKCVRSFATKYAEQKMTNATYMKNPKSFADYAQLKIGNESEERLLAFFLNNKFALLKTKVMTEGSVNRLTLSPTIIARNALKIDTASAVVICHNHPGGSTGPSEDDNEFTRAINDTLKTVGIKLIDHVIISKNGYYSYRFDKTKTTGENPILTEI